MPCGPNYPRLLRDRNAARSTTEKSCCAQANLHEDQHGPIPHDKIDFAKTAAVVSLEQHKTMLREKLLSAPLRINTGQYSNLPNTIPNFNRNNGFKRIAKRYFTAQLGP